MDGGLIVSLTLFDFFVTFFVLFFFFVILYNLFATSETLLHNALAVSPPPPPKKRKNITRRTDCSQTLFDFFITFAFSVLNQDSPVKHPHKTHAMLITPPPPKKKEKNTITQSTAWHMFQLELKNSVRKLMMESVHVSVCAMISGHMRRAHIYRALFVSCHPTKSSPNVHIQKSWCTNIGKS